MAAEPLAVAVGAVGFPTQSTSVAVTVWLGAAQVSHPLISFPLGLWHGQDWGPVDVSGETPIVTTRTQVGNV